MMLSLLQTVNLFCSSEYEYELWLRKDLYTMKHTQWFYFRVTNTKANVNYRFTIVNLSKVGLGLGLVRYVNPLSISVRLATILNISAST